MSLLLLNAKLVNGEIKHIYMENGFITNISNEKCPASQVVDLKGEVYVSGGWIDMHTHAFPKFAPYCAEPDEIGYKTGVTTVVDAGSSGSDAIGEFYELSKKVKTRVLAFINVSKIGLKRIDELSDLANLQFEPIQEARNQYPDFIVGIKARMSASVVKGNGIKPLLYAKDYAKKLGLPVMVHVGSEPPKMEEVLDQLEAGDIVTHCFHGKPNNLFKRGDFPIPECMDALNRGVVFDIGHGTESFSFEIAKKAKQHNILFHTISTDIYNKNQKNGPVYDMATTLTKFLSLGFDLEAVIQAVTERPAAILKKEKLGKVEEGCVADLTLFTIENGEFPLTDSSGYTVTCSRKISPKSVVLGGEYIELV